MKLSVEEAKSLAGEIERNGGNAESLKTAIEQADNHENSLKSIPAEELGDEEYLELKRAQTKIEEGTDLECMICHDKFDHLLSGTCEVCWRDWMLSAKPEDLKLRKQIA
uniref:Uncharacterized protein n=1 Tax=viral metagenome TaxID=1070528 RepID=A0A6M3M903_9ZZZZ